MIKSIRFLRFFGVLLMLGFASPVLAEGYSCPAYMKYTSCNSNYYMTVGGNYDGTPVAGNSCATCPAGCTCAGGTAAPVCCTETTDTCVNQLGAGWSGTAYYKCPGKAWDYSSCVHTQACTPSNNVSNADSTSCPPGTQTKTYNGSYGACSTTCTAATCGANFYKNGNACTACSLLGDGSYTTSSGGNSSGAGACYKGCSLACTQPNCQANADCSYGSSSTNGTQAYGGGCSAAASSCSVTKTCNTGYYGDTSNANACTICTNAKPSGASYTGNSTTNNCPWGSVAIPAGQYYQFSTKSFQVCPTGKYCPGGGTVNSGTAADTGIAGDCTNRPSNTSNWTYTGTGITSVAACPIQISSCNANYVYTNNGTASATCSGCSNCSAGNGATCSLSVVGNTCTYTTGCSTGYGSIQNSGKYNPVCYANTYTVTLDSQVGIGGTESVTATYNSAMPAATMPTRLTYTFLGFFDATSGGKQYYSASGTSARNWDKANNASLYAQWTQSGAVCSAGQYLPKNSTTCTACTGANYCTGGTYALSATTDQGINVCPTGYMFDTTNGKSSASQCQIAVESGKYIATTHTASQTSCAAGTSKAAHSVNYGSTSSCDVCSTGSYGASSGLSSCTTCPTGYTTSGSTATDHDTITDCRITCPSGNYLANPNDALCKACLTGYTCVGGLFNYGLSGGIQANKYTITLSDGAGSGGSGSIQATFGLAMQTVAVPTLLNYNFTGYYTSGGVQYYNATGQSSRNWDIASNTTLTAQWVQSGSNCAAGQYLPKNSLICASCPEGRFCAGGTYSFNASLDQGTQNCPAGYTDGGAGLSAQSQCKINVTEGKYIAAANTSAQTSCAAGTSKAAHSVNYGLTSGCTACTGATYSAAGAGSCTSCPAGYTANTTSNKTAASQCQISVGHGQYITTPNSAAPAACTAGTFKAAHLVSYGSTSSCSVCASNTYSASGAQTCTACLVNYATSGTTAADHDSVADCKISCSAGKYLNKANDTSCSPVDNGFWSGGATNIPQGTASPQTACPSGYANSDNNRDSQQTCYTVCGAGTHVATPGGTCSVLTKNDAYIIENYVYYGDISIASTCNTTNGYYIKDSVLATGHDAVTDCKATCNPGTHVANAGDTCTTCPAGKFCPSAVINYGSVGNAQSCPISYTDGGTGLTGQNQCKTKCPGGYHVGTPLAACTALTTDNAYVEEHIVTYGSSSVTNTCDTTNGYFITNKLNAADHDARTDCYQTCKMTVITPPTGSVKTPKNETEYYPLFCVFQASCPLGYIAREDGDKYDNSGYTTSPYCDSTPLNITFVPNGGKFPGTDSSYTKTCMVGASCILNDSELSELKRPGFIFGGWAKTPNGKPVYQNGQNLSGLEVLTVNFYAVWEKCADGHTWNGRTCAICPIGSWAADVDATGSEKMCISCGAGGTTDAAGSTSSADCKYCPEGSFCGTDGGIANSCSGLGDGSWTESNNGAQTSSDCYKSCPEFALIYGTAIAKNATESYPTACQYSCTSDTGNPGRIENGTCVETSCKNTYEMLNGICTLCNRDNALSYKPGTNCVIDSCVMGYHPNGQKCEENIIKCSVPNSIDAEQKWDFNTKAYGICTVKTCDIGYHVSSNACVLDDQTCAVENGTGTKEWDPVKNTWGKCVVTSCNPGYSSDASETNDRSKQCGQCKNKFSVLGDLAVSSYTVGCEIASCMYQGEMYNLDNNECTPICDVIGYEDETGSMKWDPSRKKCVRQCKEGYTMW